MSDIKSKYYQYYGIPSPTEKFEQIQDPGAKSIKSLMDKILRKVEIQGNRNFVLGDVKDMSRCSILLDSYRDVPKFLIALKEEIPSLTGDISRFANGYIGIHLNFKMEGITVEVQLSTQKAWEAKQLSEYCYAKWRNFNLYERNKEIINQRALLEKLVAELRQDPKNEKLRATLKKQNQIFFNLKQKLRSDLDLQKQETEMTQKLFRELHSDGELASVESDIESMLASFEANNQDLQTNEHDYDKILSQPFKVREDGKLDREALEKQVTQIHDEACKTQDLLINSIQKILHTQNQQVFLPEKIAQGIMVSRSVMNLFDEGMKESIKNNDSYLQDNIHDISAKRFKIATAVTRFALVNDLAQEDVKDILYCFYRLNDDKEINNLTFPHLEEMLDAKTEPNLVM